MQMPTWQPAGTLSAETSRRSSSRAQVERAERCWPSASVGEPIVQPIGPSGPSMRSGDQPRGTEPGRATEPAVSAATDDSGPAGSAVFVLAAARGAAPAAGEGWEESNRAAGAASGRPTALSAP